MKFDLYRFMFTIFFYSTLFVIVIFILKHDWKDIETMEMVARIGTIGGLMYFSELFKREMTPCIKSASLEVEDGN